MLLHPKEGVHLRVDTSQLVRVLTGPAQATEGTDDATLDAKVLEYVPAYPATVSVTTLVKYLFGLKNARRVDMVRTALRRLGGDKHVIVLERERWTTRPEGWSPEWED